ncbi:hypothetical protein DM02DRAFT_73198 [Periconia macrospinosa]|uniref:Uncharacterized protein n=1 Tax=Periconia macrospinosa TaxID=97972 RepID=A0A2V1DKU0_9PLEO|nr:hypothetical protein DM02DRAFT_73198 [Periconia macrospinosa]
MKAALSFLALASAVSAQGYTPIYTPPVYSHKPSPPVYSSVPEKPSTPVYTPSSVHTPPAYTPAPPSSKYTPPPPPPPSYTPVPPPSYTPKPPPPSYTPVPPPSYTPKPPPSYTPIPVCIKLNLKSYLHYLLTPTPACQHDYIHSCSTSHIHS